MPFFRRKFLLKSSPRGDTIIEVLIAMTVVGFILSGAYVAASSSLNATRQAQERAEATTILQGQVETLRAIANDPSNTVASVLFPSSPTYFLFCLGDTSSQYSNFNPPLPPLANDHLDSTVYDSRCLNKNTYYNLAIEADKYPTDPDLFIFHARWYRVGGGKDEVELYYRIHKSSVTAGTTSTGPGGNGGITDCQKTTQGCNKPPFQTQSIFAFYYVIVNNSSLPKGLTVQSCQWTATPPVALSGGYSPTGNCQPGKSFTICYDAEMAGYPSGETAAHFITYPKNKLTLTITLSDNRVLPPAIYYPVTPRVTNYYKTTDGKPPAKGPNPPRNIGNCALWVPSR